MSSVTLPVGRRASSVVNDRDAEFTAFFRSEYPALVRTLYVVVHDRERAQDLAQDAFVQLFARWRRISHYERPDAWLRRVAIRMAVRGIRRERLRPRLERELDPAPLPKPIDIDVLRAIQQLPTSQRAAVALFYLEDRPISEVAEILACAEVTAKVHLHRARKRLAALLGERQPEPGTEHVL
ncbi:MAG TPA: sigma-70 family RNA polymerase sigma factor [Actinomycetota bacterium]|nr:sigma-70 family RNA polymerase sigma factor [Actinomycetota bacterium]